MSLESILRHVQTLAGSVTGIGSARVHLGKRQLSPEMVELAAQVGVTVPLLHLWQVYRSTVDEDHLSTGSNTVSYPVTIAGYYQLRDPSEDASPGSTIGLEMTSEVAASALERAVCDALRSDGALHGGGVATNCSPPRCVVWGEKALGTTNCHYFEIQIVAEEEILISYA